MKSPRKTRSSLRPSPLPRPLDTNVKRKVKSVGEPVSLQRMASDSSQASSVVTISSSSSEAEVSPKRNKILNQLQSSLSDYWTPEMSTGRHSRYGRRQKPKEMMDGFVPTDLARFIPKNGSRIEHFRKARTPTRVIPGETSFSHGQGDRVSESREVTPVREPAPIRPRRISTPPAALVPIDSGMLSELDFRLSSVTASPKEPTYGSDVDSGRGSSIDFQEQVAFKFGTLYWAKFTSKCLWPCLICPIPADSLKSEIFNFQNSKIHVRFFADNGRRAWVLTNNLIPYLGLDELKERGITFETHYKKFPEAIAEANSYLQMEIDARVSHFIADMEQKIAERQAKQLENARQRQLLSKLRSPTPESPQFEDFRHDIDRQSLESDLKSTLNSAKAKQRKRQLSQSTQGSPRKMPRLLTMEERVMEDYLTEDFCASNMYGSDLKKEPVCQICYRVGGTEGLEKCTGSCCGLYHLSCTKLLRNGLPAPVRERKFIGRTKSELKKRHSSKTKRNSSYVEPKYIDTAKIVPHLDTSDPIEAADLVCFDCEMGFKYCFVCQEEKVDEPLISCMQQQCGRLYHVTCLDAFPQAVMKSGILTCCPLHTCHTCVGKDSANHFTVPDKKLIKCVLCPTSYHYASPTCILAGTEFLTTSRMICGKHPLGTVSGINTNWCFVCSKGGELICCEQCPVSNHMECLRLASQPDRYICDACETGQRPLYNEVVWAKMGGYRFWPAICLPHEVVPLNMLDLHHAPNDICVRFFGSKDYAWLPSDRMFSYEKGDSEKNAYTLTKSLDGAYSRALVEAEFAFDKLQSWRANTQLTIATPKPKPGKYVQLKTNFAVPPIKLADAIAGREVGEHLSKCLCKPEINDCSAECLNRALMVECDPSVCPCGEKCTNNMFSRRLYPKTEVRFTGQRGFGLFAAQNISEGDFVIEYVGELISTEEYERRRQEMERNKDDAFYFMTLSKGVIIDAGKKGNLSRFINHSCDPNCITETWRVGNTLRVGLFATTNIEMGNELTFDYQFEGSDSKTCYCGSSSCKGEYGNSKSSDL